jgi:outer membrane protein
MRKQLAITLLGLGLATSQFAAADVVGAGASIGYWDAGLSGNATQGADRVDVENELDLDGSDNVQFSASLEHPVPVLPNVRLGFTRLEQTGSGELGASFGNLATVGSVDVRSELNLDQLDLTFYYEVLDNWVNLDAGLTARSIDGELLIEERADPTNANRTEIDAILPMLYLAARFDVPGTDISFGAEGNGVGYSGDSILDAMAYGQYDISVLRVQAGYRRMSIDVEDGDESLDVDIDGPFVSVGLDF